MKKLFVVIASVALIAAFATSASAQNEWSLYGNARIQTFSVTQDFGNAVPGLTPPVYPYQPGILTEQDDTELIWSLQGNSRVGATIKGENLSARFEYGTGVNLRRLYGDYDFGGWSLGIGQDYTPVTEFISGQVGDGDLGLIGTGAFYGSRRAQLRARFSGFEVALIDVTGESTLGLNSAETDVGLPLIEAKYKYSADMFSFHAAVGYQTFDVKTGSGTTGTNNASKTFSVDSYAIILGGTLNLGPATIGAGVSQGQNIGSAGWLSWNGDAGWAVAPGASFFGYSPGVPIVSAGSLNDVTTLQYFANVVWKTSDKLALELGAGFKEDDYDIAAGAFGPGSPAVGTDDQMVVYINAVWEVAPGVFIIPEFGMVDWKDVPVELTGTSGFLKDEGDVQYFGAKWQINF